MSEIRIQPEDKKFYWIEIYAGDELEAAQYYGGSWLVPGFIDPLDGEEVYRVVVEIIPPERDSPPPLDSARGPGELRVEN